MLQAEVELKAQIDALLARAKAADGAEKNEPEFDVPEEIQRRQDRLEVIRAARERLEERQRQADAARGRTPDDERKPRDPDGHPCKGGSRYARDFGVSKPKARENFTDPQSRITKRAGLLTICANGYAAMSGHLRKQGQLTGPGCFDSNSS